MSKIEYLKTMFGSRIGYFGERDSENLGDVAVYEILKRHTIGRSLYGLIDHCQFADSHHFARRLRRCSHILIGGGTQICRTNAQYFQAMHRRSIPIWTFGTGVGSCGFSEPPDANIVDLLPSLKHVEHLTVRGPLSLAALRNIGIETAETVGDPALGYVQTAAKSLLSSGVKKCCINLVRPFFPGERAQFDNFHAEVIEVVRRLQKKGWTFDFIALEAKDEVLLREVIREYGLSNVSLHCFTDDVDGYLETIRGYNLFFGTRLHASILATCAGVPFLLVNYRSKCADFTASIDLNEFLIEPTLTADAIEDRFDWILGRANLRSTLIQRAKYYRAKQIKFLDNLGRN